MKRLQFSTYLNYFARFKLEFADFYIFTSLSTLFGNFSIIFDIYSLFIQLFEITQQIKAFFKHILGHIQRIINSNSSFCYIDENRWNYEILQQYINKICRYLQFFCFFNMHEILFPQIQYQETVPRSYFFEDNSENTVHILIQNQQKTFSK